MLHQARQIDLGIVDVGPDGAADLAQVVGRDVGRHPDRDPRGAVDQQVREARRQDQRLLRRLVVVGAEVDRIGIDVAQQLGGETLEARLGVVTDEAVGQERVLIGIDPERVDRLDPGGENRLDLGVEVLARQQGRNGIAGLPRFDPLEDHGAPLVGLATGPISVR